MQESGKPAPRLTRAQSISQKRYFPALFFGVLALVAASAITPFYVRYRTGVGAEDTRQGMIWTHDMVNHLAVAEMFYKGLKSGDVYPRWLADANYGYGIPLMIFYPPGFYFLTSGVHELTQDWGNTMLVVSVLVFLASGMAFYYFARAFLSRLPAALASLVYVVFPYHIIDLYPRGAMAELLGFVFIPLIMYFAYRVGAEGRLRHYGGLGLCYGLYLISHMPVGYMFSYALAFYAVVWAVMKWDLRIILRIAAGMVIGLALGAVYWLPAVLEGRYAQEEVTNAAPYEYSYITMIKSDHPFDWTLHAQFALLVLTLIAVILFLSKTWRRAGEGADDAPEAEAVLRTQARLWMILAVGAAFMSTSLSSYISMMIPRIQASTPAWRWLTVGTVFTCMLVGLAVERVICRAQVLSPRPRAWRGTVMAALILNVVLTVVLIALTTIYHEPQWVVESFISQSFNPKGATRVESLPQTETVVANPQAEWTEIEVWDPQYRRVRVHVGEATEVRLRTYYFPGWAALVDGQPAPLMTDADGVQLVSVPPGEHTIETSFGSTRARKAGAVSFGAALTLIFGLVGADYLVKRKKRGAKSAAPAKKDDGAKAIAGSAAVDSYSEADL